MKKLTLFSLPLHARLPRVLVTAAFIGVCLSGTALAEEKVWEIQSGNVLSKIVAEHYPGYANTQAIMQEILKRNPTAFSKPDVNSLIVGKTLTLPDAKDIPELEPPPPDPSPPQAGADPAAIAELKDTIAMLQEENAGLQEMVKGAVEAPAPDTNATDALQKQLDEAKQSLQESEAAKRTLEEQLASAKRDNETLQNDLQQIRAAVAVAENNAASAGNLPWILLGLLALLTIPLIWLLRRKREPVALVPTGTATATAAVDAPAPASAHVRPAVAAAVSPDDVPEMVTTVVEEVEEGNADAALKLDIARAYLDLRDAPAAADILKDVLVEGVGQQRQEAREILSFIT
ncbi:hypothetical protein J9253_14570 [Thiothrix litoralis]|jgi:FimV-like protein|uniref:FimV N-terminal domain-containing protein n=1 Tax=Thiothrix litoralis TaxID=2891210 RepID=A0ABX7WP10_9GAMM|nr:FimV/HubP family polar landmark protein [Thiothrix litoralis]QTR45220.1 hypothetical protein J9253_14570 [Thiothrix litoralis]